MDDDFDECEHPTGTGLNWPSTASARLNWTDPFILVTTLGEVLGSSIEGLSHLAGSMLKAHSNTIAQRQRFKAEAGMFIESLTGGDHRE